MSRPRKRISSDPLFPRPADLLHMRKAEYDADMDAVKLCCAACGQMNRVPSDKLAQGPKCGICGAALADGRVMELDGAAHDKAVRGDDLPLIVDYWAAWCGPCRQFAPVYETASDAHPDIVFAKVDTEAEPGLAQVFQISSIPTLMAIRDGVVLYSQAGALPEQALSQVIQAVRDVDMTEVRASIEAEKSQKSP